MTKRRDLKKLIRERQAKTGEAYTAARLHVLRGGAGVGEPEGPDEAAAPQRVEAVVLKVNEQSARVRVPGEESQVTVRMSSYDAWRLVPGHIATLLLGKRWTWRGAPYASGQHEAARIDIPKLGLAPLPLTGGDLEDLADGVEPYDDSADPYTRLWREFTSKPRPTYEFDPIAWGALPGRDIEDNPTCNAAELADAGDMQGATELLMDALCEEPRCIDAHAHLGNWAFDDRPQKGGQEVQGLLAEQGLPRS